jgi:CSLREA domain-containing protein
LSRFKHGKLVYRVLLGLSLTLLGGQTLTSVQASSQGLPLNHRPAAVAAGNTYIVNSTDDTVDADVGKPACADANGKCTLRAAIMQANFTAGPDTIILPAGVYLLTRAGDDDLDVLGDLDITDDLTIQGAGSGVTIVDGNGAVTGDRVFQVLASAKETSLSGLTIRNGKKVKNTFDEGGGLYWDGGGGHLQLNDVVVERNSAGYGGGLYLNYSSSGDTVDITHLVVHANTATTGAAGGLAANFSDFASFDMQSSQIYSNTAYEAGGLYFQSSFVSEGLSSVRIETSDIYSNTASLSAGFENHSGNANGPVVLLNSRIHNNRAGFYGAAIGNYGALGIYTSTLEANTAGVRGGGLYNYEGGQVDVVQSTLDGNYAQFGGGFYSELFIHNSAALTMTNSTLSGNSASRDGGGIYAVGGQIKLYNTTVADNHVLVPIGTFYAGLGGGVYITGTASLDGQNMLLADNTHQYRILPPEPDDCFGFITSLGYSLIETPGANCTIFSLAPGNITGQDPLLGPLENNGGATQTQSPLAGSPVIDAGETPNCTDGRGAPIQIDQRNFNRPKGANCDIGAVEYYPFAPYLPFVRK